MGLVSWLIFRVVGNGCAGAALAGSTAQSEMREREDVGMGAGAGHGDADAAEAAGDLGVDLEQPEPDGAAGGALEGGVGQCEAAERGHRDVGHGGEP